MFSARMAKDVAEATNKLMSDVSEARIVLSAILNASYRGQQDIVLPIREERTFEVLMLLDYIVVRVDENSCKISWASGHKKRNDLRTRVAEVFDELVDNLTVQGTAPTDEDRMYFIEAIWDIGK